MQIPVGYEKLLFIRLIFFLFLFSFFFYTKKLSNNGSLDSKCMEALDSNGSSKKKSLPLQHQKQNICRHKQYKTED